MGLLFTSSNECFTSSVNVSYWLSQSLIPVLGESQGCVFTVVTLAEQILGCALLIIPNSHPHLIFLSLFIIQLRHIWGHRYGSSINKKAENL